MIIRGGSKYIRNILRGHRTSKIKDILTKIENNYPLNVIGVEITFYLKYPETFNELYH